MIAPPYRHSAPTRPAFTLVELLVALALVILVMAIVTRAFSSSSRAFRNLKASGDMQERLRGDAEAIRRDLTAANLLAASLVSGGLRDGAIDCDSADDLMQRYGAVATAADELESSLKKLERQTSDAADRRVIRRLREDSARVETVAVGMVESIRLVKMAE